MEKYCPGGSNENERASVMYAFQHLPAEAREELINDYIDDPGFSIVSERVASNTKIKDGQEPSDIEDLRSSYKVVVTHDATGVQQVFERSDLEDFFTVVRNEEKVDAQKYGLK